MTEKIPITLPDGREGFEYPDGAVRSAGGGYMVRPPYAHSNFNSETGSAIATKRQDDIREAAALGIMDASDTDSETGAARASTRAIAEIIFDNEEPGMSRVQAYKATSQQAGWTRDKGAAPVVAILVNIGGDLMNRFAPELVSEDDLE